MAAGDLSPHARRGEATLAPFDLAQGARRLAA